MIQQGQRNMIKMKILIVSLTNGKKSVIIIHATLINAISTNLINNVKLVAIADKTSIPKTNDV